MTVGKFGELWMKDIWQFFVLLQLFSNSEITSKYLQFKKYSRNYPEELSRQNSNDEHILTKVCKNIAQVLYCHSFLFPFSPWKLKLKNNLAPLNRLLRLKTSTNSTLRQASPLQVTCGAPVRAHTGGTSKKTSSLLRNCIWVGGFPPEQHLLTVSM